jgi:hypothetical protein
MHHLKGSDVILTARRYRNCMQAFCEGFKLLLVLTKKLTEKKYRRKEKESGGQR